MNTIQEQLNTQPYLKPQPQSSHRYPQRTNISKYFWSHGVCTNTDIDYKSKRSGHQAAAVSSNKMGVSTAYCQPVN